MESVQATDATRAIELPPITDAERREFNVTTRHGRAAIADVITRELDIFCGQYFDEPRRHHFGASQVGHECNLFLWRTFRWQKEDKFNGNKKDKWEALAERGKMMRLFNTGHREEVMFITYLRGIGFTVEEIDPATNKQYRIYAAHRHFGGSSDGIGPGFPDRYGLANITKLLFEFKTANDKSYQKTFNTGLRDTKPQHWSQICSYGYKMDIDYVLYLVKNKNNDALYAEIEEIDKAYGKQEIDKAHDIIFQMYPPPKIQTTSMMPPCKWCHFRGICFQGEATEKNCRSCQHATPVEEGQWRCGLYSAILPEDFIPKGCDHWKPI
jgi:hypothetical protein